jgi:hypothetical protein
MVARSAADLIAAVPYLLGFHPADSLVVIAFCADRVDFAARYDLPPPGTPPAQTRAEGRHMAAVIRRQGARTVAILGYGDPARIAAALDPLADALTTLGAHVAIRLRTSGDRYWDLGGPGPDIAEGHPLPDSPLPAEMVFAGQVALPDRATLAASLAAGAPPADPVPAVTRLGALLRTADDPDAAVHRAGRAAVRQAVRRARSGRSLTDDEIAWLGVLLEHLPTRDHVWEHLDGAPWQLDLWSGVLRRVAPAYVPAPAGLLAFAAWRAGQGALASIAVERALAADPAYPMALLLDELLRYGVPPSELDTWPLRRGRG